MQLKIRQILVTSVIALSMGFVACSKKEQTNPDEIPVAGSEGSNFGSSDAGNAMGLQSVNFGYDSFSLDGDSKSKLQTNAKILKDNSKLRIQIEGHCDERGSTQYNIALGERRASSTRNFLIDSGVEANRVEMISYGEEKPLDNGHDESAWAKNRRANFVIISK